MSLMVKFGQTLIFKENIQNLSEESKKSEWTENKFYKSATSVEVKPKFDLNREFTNKDEAVQSLVGKLKTNKEILDKISNVYFRDRRENNSSPLKVSISNSDYNNTDNKFLNFKKDLLNDYLDDRALTKKRNLVILTKSMTNFKNINNTDIEELNKIDTDELSKYKTSKFLNLIKKYKYDFLLSEEYKSLNAIENNNFRKFLDSEQKKQSSNAGNSGIHNINDFCFDFTNKSNLNQINNNVSNTMHPLDSFNLLSHSISQQNSIQNFLEISTDVKRADSSDLMVSRLVLFEDFRHLVANYSLSDDQILKYFQLHEDITKAAEMYFKEVYRANSLTVIFIMPNSTPNSQKYSKEFSFIESPEELFMYVYSIYPNANDPKLYKTDGSEIKIDPVNDKFIGKLKLQQNAILYVKF
jgi:hypothetical protein